MASLLVPVRVFHWSRILDECIWTSTNCRAVTRIWARRNNAKSEFAKRWSNTSPSHMQRMLSRIAIKPKWKCFKNRIVCWKVVVLRLIFCISSTDLRRWRLDQQRMIGELKFQQDQQVLHQQMANLEALKEHQVDPSNTHLGWRSTISRLDGSGRQTTTAIGHRSSPCHGVDSSPQSWWTAEIEQHQPCRVGSELHLVVSSGSPNSSQTLTDRVSTRSDLMLVNMEERARQRNALKNEREAKRRAIEEEKLTRVQRKRESERENTTIGMVDCLLVEMMDEKIRQEEEEKRMRAEEAREKRRLEKERELERKHFDERMRVLGEKADVHCRYDERNRSIDRSNYSSRSLDSTECDTSDSVLWRNSLPFVSNNGKQPKNTITSPSPNEHSMSGIRPFDEISNWRLSRPITSIRSFSIVGTSHPGNGTNTRQKSPKNEQIDTISVAWRSPPSNCGRITLKRRSFVSGDWMIWPRNTMSSDCWKVHWSFGDSIRLNDEKNATERNAWQRCVPRWKISFRTIEARHRQITPPMATLTPDSFSLSLALFLYILFNVVFSQASLDMRHSGENRSRTGLIDVPLFGPLEQLGLMLCGEDFPCSVSLCPPRTIEIFRHWLESAEWFLSFL